LVVVLSLFDVLQLMTIDNNPEKNINRNRISFE